MNPVKTLCFTLSLVALLAASAAAQTLYFYPPDDAKWIAGRAYISRGNAATARALTLDSATGCGWYKTTIPSGDQLRDRAQFFLGKPGKDRIGPGGRWMADFDDLDEAGFTVAAGAFNLGNIFNRLGNTIYLVADDLDPSDPNAGWYGSNPGIDDPLRCKFDLAAFIYDTDPSKHPDFSCGLWNADQVRSDLGNGPETMTACAEAPTTANLKGKCLGVIKGLAKDTLNRKTKKIECGNCTKNECWSSPEYFNKAFTSTPGTNVQLCYNMPFEQVKSGNEMGSFKFDSDKLTNRQTPSRLVGGFFPWELNTQEGQAYAGGDYSQCEQCRTKRSADRFNLIDSTRGGWQKWATKAQYDDLVNAFYEYKSKPGDFADAKKPNKKDLLPNVNFSSDETIDLYDWTCRRRGENCPDGGPSAANNRWKWYLHGTTELKNIYDHGDSYRDHDYTEFATAAKANQHFCFESHAQFYYDPDQKFYFSGDDPIWVYINNKLVIDLGGAHLSAPDHVDLKDLGLTEGELYDIDIFFCDQRTVNSNVRISTNMYIAQKSTFYNDLAKADNTMCAAIQKGADCASKMGMGGTSGSKPMCGTELISGGYTVDFYMINRVTKDTIYLSPARGSQKRYEGCSGQNDFKCNGDNGIVVNKAIYTCGGRGQCKGNPEAAQRVGIQGSFNVYARLMENGVQVPGSKPLLIDAFKGESNDRIVWGTLAGMNGTQRGVLKDAYDKTSTQRQEVIVGKRIPVYITTGSWGDDNFTSFEYDDDPEIAGHAYTLQIGGSGINIYESATSVTPIGKNSYSGTLDESGIATLWVQIDYDVEDKREYTLNVTSEGASSPSLKIVARQPTLKFVEGGTLPDYKIGGWENWKTGGDKPPYFGSPLDLYVQALDPANNNELCDVCNTSSGFILREKSESKGNCPAFSGRIVISDGLKMEKGKASITIRGQESTGEPVCTAEWTVYGLSSSATTATWTGLRFRDAPIPMPKFSKIFDRNNDGVADSIYVVFSKPLSDTLRPILLQVVWGDTAYFNAPGYDENSLKDGGTVKNLYQSAAFRSTNNSYWSQFMIGDTAVGIGGGKDGKPLYFKFKSGRNIIKTSGGDEDKVSSYIPFVDLDNGQFQYSPSPNTITDGIAPIVTKAVYTPAWTKNCENGVGSSDADGCREQLVVTLSERTFQREGTSTYDIKNPFSYCLKSQKQANCTSVSEDERFSLTFNNLGWKWEVPKEVNEGDTAYNARYMPGSGGRDDEMNAAGGGDSIATLIYYHWKTNTALGETTHKPKAGDWVKFRLPSEGTNVLVDAEGNPANWYGEERGVVITGKNNPIRKQVKIAAVNPNEEGPLGGIFEPKNRDQLPDWWSEGAKDAAKDLFKTGSISEILPVINTDPKEVQRDYPGSVGAIFDVGSTFSEIEAFLNEEGQGRSLPDGVNSLAGAITIHASAYYHTNLGDYTAHKEKIEARCSDAVFSTIERDNCIGGHFYVAWDLKTNSNPPRFVGAGAYVGITKFYVQFDYKDAGGAARNKQFGNQEFIEMYGVKRQAKVSAPPAPPLTLKSHQQKEVCLDLKGANEFSIFKVR